MLEPILHAHRFEEVQHSKCPPRLGLPRGAFRGGGGGGGGGGKLIIY